MRNPVTLKCDSELQKAVKAYCNAKKIRIQHFTEEALKEKLEAANKRDVPNQQR